MEEAPELKHHLRLFTTYGLPVVWFLLLGALFSATNPIDSGPVSVLAALVLIYLLIASTLYAMVAGIVKLMSALGFRSAFNLKMAYYLISVISFGPVFMIALSTLGQLEIKDVVLVVILLALGCFYVVRRGKSQSA